MNNLCDDMTYAFLSHSSKDKQVVEELAQRLGKERVFFDKWDLEGGDVLPAKIAEGIVDPSSKWFILIASKDSMDSHWVKYEVNVAILRQIEEENYKIIILKIDDCLIHPELSPYLRIDGQINLEKSYDEIAKIINSEGRGLIPRRVDWRKSVVDRYQIIEAVENASNEGYKIIILWGIYGIGKTALAEHIVSSFFNKGLAKFRLTEGHDLFRLVAEMSARAKIAIPDSYATEEQLMCKGLEAIEELIRQDRIIFFDDADLVTEDDYGFKDYLQHILRIIPRLGDIPPILIASNYHPKLDFEIDDISTTIKVNPLEDHYIRTILEKWLKSSNPENEMPCKDDLNKVAKQLYGYPLAARLAANVITKYSVEVALSDLSHFKSIRLDIAKQLLGRSKKRISETQQKVLQILTLADIGLTQYDISKILDSDPDSIRVSLDRMFLDQIIYLERTRIQILPLMKDYFWNSIHRSGSLKEFSNKIAMHCKFQLSCCEHNSEEFVNYCSIAYRLFIMSDNELEARQLAYYFKGELKEAAKRLYYARNYILSLKYIEMWLSVNQKDYDAKLLKARCLTHIEKYEDAERELEELKKSNFCPFKVYHSWGLMYRQKNQLEKAIYYFKKGIDYRPDYLPLLRDYGDVLYRVGNLEHAYNVLEIAYDIAPRDPYIASKYADILEKKGLIDEAIDIIVESTITFPDSAPLHHRLSMLYYAKGNFNEAYNNASIACRLDPTLYEAVTHLASLDLDIGNVELTKMALESLPSQLTYNDKMVRDTIYAKMLLREGKTDEARKKLMHYDYTESPYIAAVLANIECKEASEFFNKNQLSHANDRLKKGEDILVRTIEKFPNNQGLKNGLVNVSSLSCIYNRNGI